MFLAPLIISESFSKFIWKKFGTSCIKKYVLLYFDVILLKYSKLSLIFLYITNKILLRYIILILKLFTSYSL